MMPLAGNLSPFFNSLTLYETWERQLEFDFEV